MIAHPGDRAAERSCTNGGSRPRNLLGDRHPERAIRFNNLAVLATERGDYDQAAALTDAQSPCSPAVSSRTRR